METPDRRDPLQAVLLDVDGTLVDSNRAHVQSWVQAMGENGFTVTAEEIHRLVGMGGDNLMPNAIGVEKESDLGKRIGDRHKQLFKEEYLPHLRAFDGVRELVQRIRADGYRIGIATSSGPDELKPLLRLAAVEDLLDVVTSARDAESSKPEPDILKVALEKLGTPARQALMLGDSPYDIQAAESTGLGVIALRCGGFSDQDLAGAVALYDDPADLLAQYDRSPLAR